MQAKPSEPERAGDIELRPDGWDRFEKAVDAAITTPPRRRTETVSKTKGPRLENDGSTCHLLVVDHQGTVCIDKDIHPGNERFWEELKFGAVFHRA